MPFMPFQVSDFMRVSPAKEAGIKVGDRLVGIDGKQFRYNDEYAVSYTHLTLPTN